MDKLLIKGGIPLDGKITAGRMNLTPTQFWPRIEQVMFATLVRRAFDGDESEAS